MKISKAIPRVDTTKRFWRTETKKLHIKFAKMLCYIHGYRYFTEQASANIRKKFNVSVNTFYCWNGLIAKREKAFFCAVWTSGGWSRGGQFGATETSVAPPWMAPLCHNCAPFWCPWK